MVCQLLVTFYERVAELEKHLARVSEDMTTRDDSSLTENGQSPDGCRFKSCHAQLIFDGTSK